MYLLTLEKNSELIGHHILLNVVDLNFWYVQPLSKNYHFSSFNFRQYFSENTVARDFRFGLLDLLMCVDYQRYAFTYLLHIID